MLNYKLSKSLNLGLLVLLFPFLFSCQKEYVKKKENQAKQVSITPMTIEGTGTNCYDYTPLIPQPDGTYIGQIDGVPISVSGVIYQAFDDDGNPIQFQQGDPFTGQINITSNYPAEVLYNSTTPTDDQFSLRVYQMGASILDLTTYEHDMEQWMSTQGIPLSNQSLSLGLYNQLQFTTKPDITKYLKSSGGVSYHDVTGRFIRINPQQVGTDGNGNPIMTTFALGASCYPRNDLRTGTSGQASITLKNVYSTSVSSPDIKVDFIQNNIVIKSLDFPSTRNTSTVPVSIAVGSYIIKYTIPAGYVNDYYRWSLSPIGNNLAGSWDTSTYSGVINSDGSRTITTGIFNISAGTAYTLLCSNLEL